VQVATGGAVPLTPELKERLKVEPTIRVVEPQGGQGGAGEKSGYGGLLSFVLQGVFWGAVSLVTPCVFPMIPITVSFFLKQSESKHHRPLVLASVYSGTIIIVLTIAAVALLSAFRWLSINPVMNIGLGALFVFFALSLFGMYEIELPSGLAQFTSSREGQGGLLGTIFMALTFTIISFACVAPFLGGFGGTAAGTDQQWLHRILGGLAFSVTFASPFFVLALFPSLLKTMPKSGNWLNSVKVVMGFLELAAALKFFRAGELVLLPSPELFTYDFTMGLYVAISLLCGLYLLGVYRLPHDTPSENLGVMRVMWALAFLGLGFYLFPAAIKTYNPEGERQRPSGAVFAWIDSFLLPDDQTDLPWVGDLDDGLKKAAGAGKLVFVDFTGKTCTNCKINEETVFTRKEIKELLQRYVLVQLYTDVVPDRLYSAKEQAELGSGTARQREDAARNLAFQRKEFGTEQLPLYVILRPTPDGGFKEVARYDEGKINNVNAFTKFLRTPLQGAVAGKK
jgi:thiol:disulfide interchange protein DsbD